MMVFCVILVTVLDLRLHVVGYDRHTDNLAVGVGNAGTGGGTHILEYEHIAELLIGLIQLLHARPVSAEQIGDVLIVHLVDSDAMFVMVNDDLVPAVAVYGLLETEVEVAVAMIVTQNRVEVFDNPDVPVLTIPFRVGSNGGRCHVLVAITKRARWHIRPAVAGHRLFGLFRPHAARRCHQHRLTRYDRVDADLADTVCGRHTGFSGQARPC